MNRRHQTRPPTRIAHGTGTSLSGTSGRIRGIQSISRSCRAAVGKERNASRGVANGILVALALPMVSGRTTESRAFRSHSGGRRMMIEQALFQSNGIAAARSVGLEEGN